jgi:hypothetical protein
MNRYIATAGAGLLMAVLLTTPAAAQLAHKKETLRGHRKVYVSVTTPATEDATRHLGLVQPSLERYILAQLSKANISASAEFTDQTLILEIQLDVHKVIRADNLDVFAFISRFEAIQAARLATNGDAALAVTWRATQFGAVTVDQAHLLRDSVINNLDAFIRDWQAAQDPATPLP